MGYFDADAQEMLELYLLEARQLCEQLSGVLLDAEKIMHSLRERSIMFSGSCIP